MKAADFLSPLQLLVFAGLTLVLFISLTTYLVLRAFRREPPGILRRSFFDATGQPNGVLLTVFNAVLILNVLTLNFIITGHSPTPYMWATWGTIVLLGIGADTAVTRAQIESGKPEPSCEIPLETPLETPLTESQSESLNGTEPTNAPNS